MSASDKKPKYGSIFCQNELEKERAVEIIILLIKRRHLHRNKMTQILVRKVPESMTAFAAVTSSSCPSSDPTERIEARVNREQTKNTLTKQRKGKLTNYSVRNLKE